MLLAWGSQECQGYRSRILPRCIPLAVPRHWGTLAEDEIQDQTSNTSCTGLQILAGQDFWQSRGRLTLRGHKGCSPRRRPTGECNNRVAYALPPIYCSDADKCACLQLCKPAKTTDPHWCGLPLPGSALWSDVPGCKLWHGVAPGATPGGSKDPTLQSKTLDAVRLLLGVLVVVLLSDFKICRRGCR